MTTTITTADQILQDAVTKHLAWEPDFDASMIGVSTQDGIVTLSGYVETYAAKLAAERAARKLYGVKAIANELNVRLAHDRIDPDIAKDAVDALKGHVEVPRGLNVTVRDGHITLEGTVEWMFQKAAAERAQRAEAKAAAVREQANLEAADAEAAAARKVALEAAQKAARDARYAGRKNRQKR